jgi:hypothetical protein
VAASVAHAGLGVGGEPTGEFNAFDAATARAYGSSGPAAASTAAQ